MYALSGMHTRSLWHEDTPWGEVKTDKETIWQEMSDADKNGDVIQTGTKNAPGGHNDSNENDIAFGHAYSVIGVATLKNGTRLVKVRNPWGVEGYKGTWSDKVSNVHTA